MLDHEYRAAAVVDVDHGVVWRLDRPDVAYQLMDLDGAFDARIDRVMAEIFPAVE